MGWLEKWSTPLENLHDPYYYVSYTSLQSETPGGGQGGGGGGSSMDINPETTMCLVQFRLHDWSDSMRIAVFALFWNLPLILWLLPWKTQYPTLNTSLQALFQSPNYGLSLQHWKKVGKVTGARMKTLAGSLPFECWVRVYICLICASMISKTLLFLSIAKPTSLANYDELYTREPLEEFVNGQTILIAMFFISDWFILMAEAPSRLLQNVAVPQSAARTVGRIMNLQVICTIIMLVSQWKIFVLCCAMTLAIMITLRIVSMATLFFLPTVGSIGVCFYWFFRLLFEPIAQRRGHTYWNHRAREWTAACVWLCVTWLAWSGCFAFMLLFFNPRFDSVICLDIDSKPAVGTFFFQIGLVISTILMIYTFGVIDAVKWNFDRLSYETLLYGFRCRNMKQFDNVAPNVVSSQNDDRRVSNPGAAAAAMAAISARNNNGSGLNSQSHAGLAGGDSVTYATRPSHVVGGSGSAVISSRLAAETDNNNNNSSEQSPLISSSSGGGGGSGSGSSPYLRTSDDTGAMV